jgi:hypothetical protein
MDSPEAKSESTDRPVPENTIDSTRRVKPRLEHPWPEKVPGRGKPITLARVEWHAIQTLAKILLSMAHLAIKINTDPSITVAPAKMMVPV